MQPAGSDRRRASRFNGRGRWSLVPAVLALLAPLALAALPAPPAQRAGSAAGAAPAVSSASPSFLLARFDLKKDVIHLSPTAQVFAIVGETLISEDLTCVTVGTLIREGRIPWLRAGIACFLGIYIGDLTFFFLGRVAGAAAQIPLFLPGLGEQRLRDFGEWFDRKPWAAIMACRFLPTIRVPLYVSVGAMTHRTKAFFWWTCFFACIWTPALVGLVVLLGGAITKPLDAVTGHGWWTIPLTIVILFALIKVVIQVSTPQGREKIKGWFTRPSKRSPSEPAPSQPSPPQPPPLRTGEAE